MSIWPGTKGKRVNVTPSTLKPVIDQHFYTVQMAEGSDEGHKHPVSPAVTDCSLRFHSFMQPYSQNDLGVEWR